METRTLDHPMDTAPRARGSAHRFVQEMLQAADVRLDGKRPWDIRLLQPGVPERVLAQGSLGLGEAYMDGWWECERLDQLFDRLPSM